MDHANAERYSVGTNAPGYGGSCCVVLAEPEFLKGEVRAGQSLRRWEMSEEEEFFPKVHEECWGAVVAPCFVSLPGGLSWWAVMGLSAQLRDSPGLSGQFGFCFIGC